MKLNRSAVRPLLALLSFGLAGAVISFAGCTSDDDSKCQGEACLQGLDASLDVRGSDATREDATGTNDSSTSQDSSTSDANDAGADADLGDAANEAATDAASDAAIDANDGGPQPLVTGLSGPWRIAIGGGYVYATTAGDVAKVAIGGGAVTTIAQGGAIDRIAADATNLYFSTLTGYIYKRAHGGTTNTPITNSAIALQVSGLTVQGTHVYWTENSNGGRVMRAAIDASTLNGEAVSPTLSYPTGVVFENGETYATESAGNTGTGRILRLNPDGGTPFPISTSRTGPMNPVADPTRIYWYENGGSTGPVYSVLLDGGSFLTHANTAVAASLAMDGTIFYYGNASGAIAKIDVAGNSKATLYSSSQTGDVYGLAVSGSSLYWTDYTGGRIMTAAK